MEKRKEVKKVGDGGVTNAESLEKKVMKHGGSKLFTFYFSSIAKIFIQVLQSPGGNWVGWQV